MLSVAKFGFNQTSCVSFKMPPIHCCINWLNTSTSPACLLQSTILINRQWISPQKNCINICHTILQNRCDCLYTVIALLVSGGKMYSSRTESAEGRFDTQPKMQEPHLLLERVGWWSAATGWLG